MIANVVKVFFSGPTVLGMRGSFITIKEMAMEKFFGLTEHITKEIGLMD